MAIYEHLPAFGGFQVVSWAPGDGLPDPQTSIARIRTDWDGALPWTDLFRAFLTLPGVEQTPGLVVGYWGTDDSSAPPDEVVEALVSARAQLPALRALFVGDITAEENEVSWIVQGDLSPLLAAYGDLTHLGVRGGAGLSLGQMDLPELQLLILQSGGLEAEVVREVMRARLPRLEHLELFLGWESYGGTTRPEDLVPLLDGTRFPALKYLGLKNGEFQDEVAQLIADAPVLDRLDTLDLSLGTLSDEGATALVDSSRVPGLRRLILRYSDCTPPVLERLRALGPTVEVEEAGDPNESWRFVALGE